jgi:hypothetical protein
MYTLGYHTPEEKNNFRNPLWTAINATHQLTSDIQLTD